ncbi:unnamed protein product [Periconia digitata]|uniref:Uncharacterized protein n=1 Tax=Periconia digitata TaxID=1303443 RepID=A0A9W4UH84_9PLEO|nr:unnamed protein product [Periconia digitata]
MDDQERSGSSDFPPFSTADHVHAPLPNRQPSNAFGEYPDWFLQRPDADLIHDFTGNLHPSEPPLMDQLWPEIAEAGNPLNELQWQIPAQSYPQPQIPPQVAVLPSTYPLETGNVDKKERRRIPFTARKLLEDSFERHRAHPYVPPEELQELVTLTGLTVRQVRTYFANARARKLPPVVDPSKSEASDTKNPPVANEQPSDPLERYLSSSSDQEAAVEDDIQEAAKRLRRPLRERRRRMSNAALSASGSNAGSSSSSAGSAESSRSQNYDSFHHRGARRGRRRRQDSSKKQITSVARKPSSPSRRFQCTFCTLDFVQKYDWRRHEESVHFPQKEWVCMPDGPVDDNSRCVFCNHHDPDKRHLDSHRSIECSDAPHAQRAFLRKDKLIQHIKQVHACQPPKMIKSWCRPISHDVSILCGLCVSVLPDWGARADHIVSHFSNGISMEMWLLERPGGLLTPDIVPSGDMLRGMATYYSPFPHPKGTYKCEICSSTFRHMSNLILHRRQVHHVFRNTDLTKEYWPNATNFGPPNASTNTNLGKIQEEQHQDDNHNSNNNNETEIPASGPSSTQQPFTQHPPIPPDTSTSTSVYTPPTTEPFLPIPALHPPTSLVPFPHITAYRNPALDFTPISHDAYPTPHSTYTATTPSSSSAQQQPPLLDPLMHLSDAQRARMRELGTGVLADPGGGLLGQGHGFGWGDSNHGGGGEWPSPFDGGQGQGQGQDEGGGRRV